MKAPARDIDELRVVFHADRIEFHVSYTHAADDRCASGAGVTGRTTQTRKMALAALRHAEQVLEGSYAEAWLGNATSYVRTTDSIGVDAG